jgi:hypothetical protein
LVTLAYVFARADGRQRRHEFDPLLAGASPGWRRE